jgi:death-on-curing protein
MLSLELAIHIHDHAISQYGGLPGIRDEGLLISALQQPFKGIGNEDFYPETLQKAAVLVFGLVKNHPFFDGNKRTGMGLLIYFLLKSGYSIEASEDQLFDFVNDMAAGNLNVEEIEFFLRQSCK